MTKRFSRYNFALKAVDGAPPAGSPAAKYKDYKAGVTKPNYVRDPSSLPGELIQVGLAAFGAGFSAKYAVQYSNRAKLRMTDTGVNNAVLEHIETVPSDAIINPGFSPAKAVVQTRGTGSTPEPSQITGVSYKKPAGAASYTYPFGKGAETGEKSVFLGVVSAIREAVETANVRNSVSFQPETWRF